MADFETLDWPLAVAWADSATAIVLNMNSLLGYDSKPRLEHMAIQLDDLWREAETLYGRMTPDLRIRLAPLRKILAENMASPRNFMMKRWQLLDSEQVEEVVVNQAEILSSHLVIAAADLFFKTPEWRQSSNGHQNCRPPLSPLFAAQ